MGYRLLEISRLILCFLCSKNSDQFLILPRPWIQPPPCNTHIYRHTHTHIPNTYSSNYSSSTCLCSCYSFYGERSSFPFVWLSHIYSFGSSPSPPGSLLVSSLFPTLPVPHSCCSYNTICISIIPLDTSDSLFKCLSFLPDCEFFEQLCLSYSSLCPQSPMPCLRYRKYSINV